MKTESAKALSGRRCPADASAARAVFRKQQSLRVFDALGHVHGLTRTARRLVAETAALQATAGGAGAARVPRRAIEARLAHFTSRQRRAAKTALDLSAQPPPARELHRRARERPRDAVLQTGLRMAAILSVVSALDRRGKPRTPIAAIEDDDRRGICIRIENARGARGNARAAAARVRLWNAVLPHRIEQVLVQNGPHRETQRVLSCDALAEAGMRVLRYQMRLFGSRLYGATDRDDPEYVHEMRVATRRMRAAWRLLGRASAPADREIRDGLSTVARALGAVRDADVFLAYLKAYAQAAPRNDRPLLSLLIRSEQRRRRLHRRALCGAFAEPAARAFLARTAAECSAPAGTAGACNAAGPGNKVPVAEAAPAALKKGLKKALRFAPPLCVHSDADLHTLRIDCKRLRYVCEILADVYPDGLKELRVSMMRMQECLGDVHDADVYTARIETFCRRRHVLERLPGAGAALNRLEQSLSEGRARRLADAERLWADFTNARNLRKIRSRLSSPYTAESPVLAETGFGWVTVGDRTCAHDVWITVDGRVRRRKEKAARDVYGTAHSFGPAELRRVCRGKPRVLYVGSGQDGAGKVTPEGREFLARQGILCHVGRTPDVLEAFNRERQPKAAVLHVTC